MKEFDAFILRNGINLEDNIPAALAVAMSNEKIAEAQQKTAKSIQIGGQKVAKALVTSSQLMFQGLSNMADEMERKRKTDEYYGLLDRIDTLEDKLILAQIKKSKTQLGFGEPSEPTILEKVYTRVNLEMKSTIQLSDSAVELLMYLFSREENRNWLIETSKFYEMSPMKVLVKLFDHYRAETDGYYLKIWFYKVNRNFKIELLKSVKENEKDFGGFYFLTDEQILAWKYGQKVFPVGVCQRKKDGSYTYDGVIEGDASKINLGTNTFYFNCDEETISNWLTELQKRFERDEWLSVERMKRIKEFQNIISEINCDIILNNLRNLHAELQSAYLSYKMEQDQKSKKEKKE